jgi:hypothetical protein
MMAQIVIQKILLDRVDVVVSSILVACLVQGIEQPTDRKDSLLIAPTFAQKDIRSL